MKIVVAGGAGVPGCVAVQDLARNEAVGEIIIADHRLDAARQVAEAVGSPRVSIADVEPADHEAQVEALRGAACCLDASVYIHHLEVMGACLEVGCSYVDLGGLFHTARRQLQMDAQFRESGACALLGGLPGIQALFAAEQLDSVEAVRAFDGYRPPPAEPPSFLMPLPALLDQLTMPPMVLRAGEIAADQPLGELEDYYFSPPIGLRPVHLSLSSLLATLPTALQSKGLRELVFKTASWGLAPETLSRLQVLAGSGFAGRTTVLAGENPVVPRDLLLALLSASAAPATAFLPTPADQPPHWTREVVTEVSGTRFGRSVSVRLATLSAHRVLPDAATASILAQWAAEGRFPPGVHAAEAVVEPLALFRALSERGMPTRQSVTENL